MGVIIRQGIKGTIANYVGVLVGVVNTLFIFPKMLSPEEIGLMRLLIDVSLIFSSFAQLGITNIMTKFFPLFKSRDKHQNGFFFYSLIYTLFGFAAFSLVFFFYQDNFKELYAEESPLFKAYFDYVYPFTFITLFTLYYETISFLHNRITVPKIIREIYLRLFTAFVVILYFFNYFEQNVLILSIVGVYLLAFIFNWINSWWVTKMSLRPQSEILNKPLLKEISIFSAFTIFSGMSGMIVAKIDTLMLGATSGLDDTGIYSIAFFIAMFIEIPKRSIDAISTPIISEKLTEENLTEVKALNDKSALNLFIAAGFLFIMIYVNTNNIFAIMPNGNIYKAGRNVILFVGLAKIIEALSGMNSAIIGYSKFYKYGTLVTFMYSFIGVLLNAILIPKMGLNGAAIATLLTILIVHLYLHLLIYQKFKIVNFSKQTVLVFGFLLLTFGINLILPNFSNPFVDSIFRSIILSSIFIFLILKSGVSEDINVLFQKFLAKYLNQT